MLRKITKLASQTRVQLSVLAISVALCCGLVNTVEAIPSSSISHLYFFGDSLTDSGFNDLYPFADTSWPQGKAPTFTTWGGYTWSQYVARDIGGTPLTVYPPNYPIYPVPTVADQITNNTTPLIAGNWPVSHSLKFFDYAAGGSTTNSLGNGYFWAPSLHSQINWFIEQSGGVLDPNALYFIWSGANDILLVLENSGTELEFLSAANTAARNIAHEVAELTKHGAKRVVVLSLPNIGYTPLVGNLATYVPGQEALPGLMKIVTFTFNSMLNQQLGSVIKKYGTKILYVDVYDLLDNVILDAKAGVPYVVAGESFYFTNWTEPSCGGFVPPETYTSALLCPNNGNTGYVFADDVHPTGEAHRLLSLVVEQEISQWQ